MKKQKRLVFLPLGGSGEIGMNMNLYGFGLPEKEKWVMIDCGVMFGSAKTPGVDVMFPDYEFIKQRRKDLLAIILTHAHEDHIGAIAHIWPDLRVPIYATPFTARMVQDKLNDLGVDVGNNLNIIPLKSKLSIGDFYIEYVSITHSIPEPNGIYLKTPTASVYHTGDWKFDPSPVLGDATDHERLTEIAAEGIHACVCDSTNALDPSPSGSEAGIKEPLVALLKKSTGRVVVTTFASNVARMKTIMQAITASGRKAALSGRSVERIYGHGRVMNYFDNLEAPIPLEEAAKLRPQDIAYICTGSQGESRSALGKIARGAHPLIHLEAGDCVLFSSKTIPGNEKAIFEVYNQLSAQDIDFITSKSTGIHVSGHPTVPDLEHLYQTLKPISAIPVHGEIQHMKRHAQIALENGAKNALVPANGDVIEIYPDHVKCEYEVEAGKIFVDGRLYEPEKTGSSAQRHRLSYAGYCSITFAMDKRGNLKGKPVIHSFGVPSYEELFGGDGYNIFMRKMTEAFESQPKEIYDNDKAMAEAMRRSYRGIINKIWGKKPITDAKVIRV